MEAAISPDGKTVAWSSHGPQGYELHLSDAVNRDPAKDRTVKPATSSNCGSDAPAWSPDGETLAYASTCTTEQNNEPQIFLWSKKTGQSRQLTHVSGMIDDIAWSPDGKSIGFLFVENATRSAGALAAMKPWAGVIGEDGVEVQRVAAVDVSSGDFSQITPESLHVYEFSWSPDSTKIAFVAAPPPGENTWWIAQLYTEDVGRMYEQIGQAKKIDFICRPSEIDSRHIQSLRPSAWSADSTSTLVA